MESYLPLKDSSPWTKATGSFALSWGRHKHGRTAYVCAYVELFGGVSPKRVFVFFFKRGNTSLKGIIHKTRHVRWVVSVEIFGGVSPKRGNGSHPTHEAYRVGCVGRFRAGMSRCVCPKRSNGSLNYAYSEVIQRGRVCRSLAAMTRCVS